MSTRVLGVIGSLRVPTHTGRLVHHVLDAARRAGAETDVIDLREDPLPLFDPANKTGDPAVETARKKFQWADAVLLGSPDYHGSVSGVMKNFLDFYWREFTGRLFGYVCASHEKGLTVMGHMRTSVRQCYGWSLPYGIGFNGDEDLDDEGNIINPRLRDRVEMLGHDLARYGALLHGQFQRDISGPEAIPGFAARHRPKK